MALPYKCSYCGGIFCSKHRLPERHNCAELKTAVPPKPYVPKKRKTSKDFVKDTETYFIKKRYVDTKKISKRSRKLSISTIFYSLFFGFIILGIVYFNYVEYLENKDLKDFSYMKELITFLNSDDTDTLTWSESFTCEDFTRTLIERGKEKGYRMSKYSLEYSELSKYKESWISYVESKGYIAGEWGSGYSHAVCEAYISELNEHVLVEPQNDAIFSKEGYKVLYGGGI